MCATNFGWTQIVTWVLVVGGWFFVNRQNNLRETRKEVRALLNSMLQDLRQLEKQALEYHCTKIDEAVAFDIRRLTKRLGSNIAILDHADVPTKQITIALVALRQATTRRNFQSSQGAIVARNHEIPRSIESAVASLEHEIEDAYSLKYHRPLVDLRIAK
jgi:hypothetical protein